MDELSVTNYFALVATPGSDEANSTWALMTVLDIFRVLSEKTHACQELQPQVLILLLNLRHEYVGLNNNYK